MLKRLLVVDDEPAILETTRFILENEGFEVTTAPDGLAALEALARSRPDAVLLDLMMPGLDGYATCRRIREDVQLQGLPVAVLTARWQRDELDKALAAGADALLRKPLDEAALFEFLRKANAGA